MPDHCLIPYDRREGIPVSAAAKFAGRSERTVRDWCEAHGIGRRIAGGPWTVSRPALLMLLDGDETALAAYLSGDRSSPTVTRYFDRAGLGRLLREWRETGAVAA